MFNLKNSPIYVKGTADMWIYSIADGSVLAYTNKVDTANFTSSVNAGEIRAGLGAPIVINIPDSSTFTGEVTSADFSLVARQLATGGVLKYNGTVMVRENITATGTSLTVTNTPVAAYGEPSTDEYYDCYVGDDGVNYGVDPATKTIQGFTAESGKTYCVRYYIEAASAQELTIPTAFAPMVARVVVRMAAYKAQGNSEMNSSFSGYLYVHVTRAQFINGDVSIDGSQTANATSSWSFQAISYDEADETCAECARDNSVLGYMVYAPCGDPTQDVESLVVQGDGVTVAVDATEQIPVFYVMPDKSLVTPNYTDLSFVSETPGTASVSTDGQVTGEAQGNTTINISLKARPTLTATCEVEVTGS